MVSVGLICFFRDIQTDIIGSTGFRKSAAVFIAEMLKTKGAEGIK